MKFFIFREFFRSVKFQNWIPRVKLEATCGRGSNFFSNGPSRRKVPFGRDRVASQGTHHKCSERACNTCPGFADQTFESKLDLKTGKLSIYSLRTSSSRSKLKSKSFSLRCWTERRKYEVLKETGVFECPDFSFSQMSGRVITCWAGADAHRWDFFAGFFCE